MMSSFCTKIKEIILKTNVIPIAFVKLNLDHPIDTHIGIILYTTVMNFTKSSDPTPDRMTPPTMSLSSSSPRLSFPFAADRPSCATKIYSFALPPVVAAAETSTMAVYLASSTRVFADVYPTFLVFPSLVCPFVLNN